MFGIIHYIHPSRKWAKIICNGEEVFAHASKFRDLPLTDMHVGSVVLVEHVQDVPRKGLQANTVFHYDIVRAILMENIGRGQTDVICNGMAFGFPLAELQSASKWALQEGDTVAACWYSQKDCICLIGDFYAEGGYVRGVRMVIDGKPIADMMVRLSVATAEVLDVQYYMQQDIERHYLDDEYLAKVKKTDNEALTYWSAQVGKYLIYKEWEEYIFENDDEKSFGIIVAVRVVNGRVYITLWHGKEVDFAVSDEHYITMPS